ncbi:MAG TPA: tRNA-dihydrouridine synthase [Candidatus Saccharimonadales bacterium]|nr:tRNA-dihydrouridine synthase [Candidatus Saccharimonadales bacterium]
MSFYEGLKKPFLILAPMDDVTDTVFRQIVDSLAPPDLYFTEFVNADGLQSPGRERLLPKLKLGKYEGLSRLSRLDGSQGDDEQRTELYKASTVKEQSQSATQRGAKSGSGAAGSASRQAGAAGKSRPIVAQIWGINPENFYKTTKLVKELGYDGVDLNMGCPVKKVVKGGACAALINNRELAGQIIDAVQDAAGDDFPVSVKTRVGFTTVDMDWIEFLLSKKLDLLSIHGRTAKQLSKVPADWDLIGQARQMRDSLCPATLLAGNGDVQSRAQAEELAAEYNLDGIMIGRGIFHDPFVFAKASPWGSYSKEQKLRLFAKHIELSAKTWKEGEYRFDALKKFCKVYINGFDGASDLRAEFMAAKNTREALVIITKDD